jgi:hypothetical protein
MQHAHHGFGVVAKIVARGDANIGRHARAEWMVACVQAPVMKVESNPVHEMQCQPAVAFFGEGALARHDRLALLSLQCPFDETDPDVCRASNFPTASLENRPKRDRQLGDLILCIVEISRYPNSAMWQPELSKQGVCAMES